MRKLEFRAGYYEWNIFIDDDCFFTFNCEIDEDIDEDTTYEYLEFIVDNCIDAMQLELEENEKEPLEEKYIPELKKQMLEIWGHHFGIVQ